jgi:hypothetical protein
MINLIKKINIWLDNLNYSQSLIEIFIIIILYTSLFCFVGEIYGFLLIFCFLIFRFSYIVIQIFEIHKKDKI